MTDPRTPGGEDDDPLRRAVEQYWDDIQRRADPRQLEQLADLLAGAAQADPGVARAALTDLLLDVLPPRHPLIERLRSATLFVGGRKTDRDTVPVTIYLTDEQYHAQVVSAVETLLAAAGLRVADRHDPVIGSWFQRMTARGRDGTRSAAAQDAEVTARLLENLAPVITALQPVRGAVIQAGALLVVKQGDAINVLQLTPTQQALLKRKPQLAQSPREISAILGLVREDRPGADANPVAVLARYAGGPAAGQDSRFPREASVSFGQPRVLPVPDDELPSPQRLDLPQLRVFEVIVPFDLAEPPDGCRYTETIVRMSFDTPGVRAIEFSRPSAGTDGDRADDCVLDTWGAGHQDLIWKLSARDELFGLPPRGREVRAVLGSPITSERLTGTLDFKLSFTRRESGGAKPSTAEPPHPLRFTLDLTDGTFETLPEQTC
jgi:hypothetical protein